MPRPKISDVAIKYMEACGLKEIHWCDYDHLLAIAEMAGCVPRCVSSQCSNIMVALINDDKFKRIDGRNGIGKGYRAVRLNGNPDRKD